jgi:hypothetical protein
MSPRAYTIQSHICPDTNFMSMQTGVSADQAAHGVTTGIARLWHKLSGRASSATNGHGGGGSGGRVSPARIHDVEIGRVEADAAQSSEDTVAAGEAQPGGTARSSASNSSDVRGPEAGSGHKKLK